MPAAVGIHTESDQSPPGSVAVIWKDRSTLPSTTVQTRYMTPSWYLLVEAKRPPESCTSVRSSWPLRSMACPMGVQATRSVLEWSGMAENYSDEEFAGTNVSPIRHTDGSGNVPHRTGFTSSATARG